MNTIFAIGCTRQAAFERATRGFVFVSAFRRAFQSFLLLMLAVFSASLFSCRSIPVKKNISRNITGAAVMSERQLAVYFLSQNPKASVEQVKRLAHYYREEGAAEGINSDVAFAQMCLETGFLRFGKLVTPDMHNYCGLGAIDETIRGEAFENEQQGVRAHIQHLHAYALDETVPLKQPLIDNRYKLVQPRGKSPTIFELTGTWAADPQYGQKLDNMLSRMEKF